MTPTQALTPQALMELADDYARCAATAHVESLYGGSKSYTAECHKHENEARSKLSAALSAAPAAPAGEPAAPIYQIRCGDGRWIDQDWSSYDYNKRYGQPVRVVYAAPAGEPVAQAAELQRIKSALHMEGPDANADPVAVIEMLRSWEADASRRCELLEQHLRSVLEVARTWQPDYATKMDRDTLGFAQECLTPVGAIAAPAPAEPAPAWQPIETAPEDVFILGHKPGTAHLVGTILDMGHPDCEFDGGFHEAWSLKFVDGVTHWMPLPAAPASPKG